MLKTHCEECGERIRWEWSEPDDTLVLYCNCTLMGEMMMVFDLSSKVALAHQAIQDVLNMLREENEAIMEGKSPAQQGDIQTRIDNLGTIREMLGEYLEKAEI